jgi:hypothetical protein
MFAGICMMTLESMSRYKQFQQSSGTLSTNWLLRVVRSETINLVKRCLIDNSYTPSFQDFLLFGFLIAFVSVFDPHIPLTNSHHAQVLDIRFYVVNFKGDWKFLMQLFCMERYATREEAWIQTMSLGFADPP